MRSLRILFPIAVLVAACNPSSRCQDALDHVAQCLGDTSGFDSLGGECTAADAALADQILAMDCDAVRAHKGKADATDFWCSDLLRPLGQCCKDPGGSCQVPTFACQSKLGAYVAAQAWDSTHAEGTVPTQWLFTSRNAWEGPYVDAAAIFPAMRDLVAGAKHEVDLETFEWDPAVFDFAQPHATDPTMVFLDGVVALQARLAKEQAAGTNPPLPVRVYVTVDGRHRKAPAQAGPLAVNKARNLYRQVQTLHLDPKLVELHIGVHERLVWGALHSKLLVVDGFRAILTGANHQRFQTLGNSWHDLGFQVKGAAGIGFQGTFDDSWKESGEVTSCDLARLDLDAVCKVVKTAPIPHPAEVRAPDLTADPALAGDVCVPMFDATRRAYNIDPLSNVSPSSPDNPQDQAFIAIMQGAEHVLKIESPDLNNDRAKAEILGALGRGVEVRVVLSLGFNDSAERQKIGGFYAGGANVDTIKDLLGRLGDRAECGRLHIRWNSKDGIRPTWAQEPGATHAKYLTADGQVAMVGSANQDSTSWNIARESNVVIDSAAATSALDAAAFDVDWARGIDVVTWAQGILDGRVAISDELRAALLGDPTGWAKAVVAACPPG